MRLLHIGPVCQKPFLDGVIKKNIVMVFLFRWSLFLLEKRHLINATKGPPLWSGVIVSFIAVVIFVVGEISALYLLIQYSFVLMLLGLSMITVVKATKYTFAPILLLLFAIPLPYVI